MTKKKDNLQAIIALCATCNFILMDVLGVGDEAITEDLETLQAVIGKIGENAMEAYKEDEQCRRY